MLWCGMFFTNLIFSLFLSTYAQINCEEFFQSVPEVKEVIEKINKKAKILYENRGSEKLFKFIDGGHDRHDIEIFLGVPHYVKLHFSKKNQIFRHYSPEHKEEILKTKKLIAGPRTFIDPEAHLKKIYNDLSGVFLTTPKSDPHQLWLGYTEETPYVDFFLPEGLAILELTPGNFLIPGARNTPPWIVNEYNKFINTGYSAYSKELDFEKIKNMGGVELALEIPISLIKKEN